MDHELPFKDLIDQTNDIVVITEADNIEAPDGPKIIYVNQAFFKLSGYTSEEVIGQTPRILQGLTHVRIPYAKLNKPYVLKAPFASTY